jgi:hemoglobin
MKTMHRFATAAVAALVGASLWIPPVHAQSSAAPSAHSDLLYKAMGEKVGLVQLVDDFVNRLRDDPRIGAQFKSTNLKNLKTQLTDQFCVISGGPCVYEGDDMKTAHASLKITKADFHALVEVLQLSMDAQGIAFITQNQLLALLAPMHRDVITVK